VQNQLDAKQTKAFQTICSSFMLSYLSNDSTIELLPHERQSLRTRRRTPVIGNDYSPQL
jgi:hypothetical protein